MTTKGLSFDPHTMWSLMSTPSRLVGQLDTSDLRLHIVFPSDTVEFVTSTTESPYSRSYYLLSARIPDEPSRPESFAVPVTTLDGKAHCAYEAVGEMAADLSSVWFGKCFDYHGVIVRQSIVQLPNRGFISPARHYHLDPYNHRSRQDLGIELNWQALSPILGLLYRRQPEEQLTAFWTATRFYARALRAFRSDPEVAFLHFVVALEVIASQIPVPCDELYDEQAGQDLQAIEEALGSELANRVRGRYFQLKRRVVYAAKTLVNDAFFEGSQARSYYPLTRDNLETCVEAVYDLRSKYAHGGMRFGVWLDIMDPVAEVQFGRPLLPDSPQKKDQEKILGNIPTFIGLERLIRFIVLRFAHQEIIKIHPRLE